jgi:hypothetical protein
MTMDTVLLAIPLDLLLSMTFLMLGGCFGLMWGLLNAFDRFFASRRIYLGPIPTSHFLHVVILLLNIIFILLIVLVIVTIVIGSVSLAIAPQQDWVPPLYVASYVIFLLAAFGVRYGVRALFRRQQRLQKS